MTTVRLELRVGEVDGSHRNCRHMFVASPASGRLVLVGATNPRPHQAAAYLYLAEHNGAVVSVELVGRRPAADGHPALWTFVATLELPERRAAA